MHAMLTRSKAASRAIDDAAKLAKALEDVQDRWAKVSAEWDASPDKETLRQIEDRMLPQETIYVDSALCLGLGSLELHPEMYAQRTDDEDELMAYCLYESTNRLRQLLIFETILKCLRKYHLFKYMLQSPDRRLNRNKV